MGNCSSECGGCFWDGMGRVDVPQRKEILEDPRLPEIYRITLAQNLDMGLFLKVPFEKPALEDSSSDLRNHTHLACSAVVIALHFGTQGSGFEPGLSHKAYYMPLHGC